MDPIPRNEKEVSPEVQKDAEILWSYQALYEEVEKSDFVIATGHDIRLVDLAVDLFKEGMATWFVASGGHKYGEMRGFTTVDSDKTEAQVYKEKAIDVGVSESSIILQDKSWNIGDVFTQLKLIAKEKNLDFNTGIFIYEPDKQRRGKASLEKQWPEIKTYVTSIRSTLEEYANDQIPMPSLVRQVVGNMKRIIEYPALGFQTEQNIPEDVMKAYENLVKAGYSK